MGNERHCIIKDSSQIRMLFDTFKPVSIHKVFSTYWRVGSVFNIKLHLSRTTLFVDVAEIILKFSTMSVLSSSTILDKCLHYGWRTASHNSTGPSKNNVCKNSYSLLGISQVIALHGLQNSNSCTPIFDCFIYITCNWIITGKFYCIIQCCCYTSCTLMEL